MPVTVCNKDEMYLMDHKSVKSAGGNYIVAFHLMC